MANANKSVRPWSRLLTALTAAILLSVFGMAAQAQAAGAPAAAQQDDDNGKGKGDDELEVYGRIEAMPPSGLIGTWIVDGVNYTTVWQTEFDQEEGAFALDVCVKLHLRSDRVTVREMESKPSDDCNRSGDDDDDDGDDDDGGRLFFGWVEEMPEGTLLGSWTISGGVYTVTAQTKIKQSYGLVEGGTCVKVKLAEDGSTVRELQSKRDVNCTGDDDSDSDGDDGVSGFGKGELYAKLDNFPPNLIGDWVIGGVTITADANTEFQQRNGPFTKDGYVKVEFIILEDGSYLAREIKTINTRDDDDSDDGDDDRDSDRKGKAFGVIESVPAGGLGLWQISGISYTVTISTELDDDRGALIKDQRVKVEYWLDAQNNRTAKEIKAMPMRADDKDGLHKLVGYVEQMPTDSFVGNWRIGGVDFVADASSRFEEEHGLLALNTFVEVKYVMQGGVRLIVKLETHVPPGGGDDNHFGSVERMDDSMAAAAAGATWMVGGRSYVVTDATVVSSNLAVGGTAVVNSYAAPDGSQVATRISSVTLDNRLYLPAAIK